MKLFYLRRHYQSIVRSNSFDGEVFAFAVLVILFGGSISLTYIQLESYAVSTSVFFSQDHTNYHLLLMIYLFLDLSLRLVFRRALPKLKYYVLWNNASRQIASQYLITSFFGIMPFVLVVGTCTCFRSSGVVRNFCNGYSGYLVVSKPLYWVDISVCCE